MPANSLPQRQSLVAQTVVFVRDHIDRGEWRDWLPSERSLCELIQVSRNTLRAALVQLGEEGVIRSLHGAGNKILLRHTPAAVVFKAQDVALLTPEPIERLRPMQSRWIDEMRELLNRRGARMRVFHGAQYFTNDPAAALARLVARNPHGCWILMLAGEQVQRWFHRHSIPCIVAGTTYPGLNLPSRDLDHRAMCRHAAGVLLGLGHRQVALLTPKSPRAGDLQGQLGFLEGVQQSRHEDARAVVIHHDATVAGIQQTVRRLLKLKVAPTGILVVHPHYYLAVASGLAGEGVRVPEQLSLISRDDDPFLAFNLPAPARYVVSPHLMARSLLPSVMELLEGRGVSVRTALITPEFFRGESLAAPRAG